MTTLVAELTDRRTTEHDGLMSRYRSAIWSSATGEVKVDELDTLSRELGFEPERIQADVEVCESWLRQRAKAERYAAMNIPKECEKAKLKVKKCEDGLKSARAAWPDWGAKSIAAGSCRSEVQRIERDNPELFEGREHETA